VKMQRARDVHGCSAIPSIHQHARPETEQTTKRTHARSTPTPGGATSPETPWMLTAQLHMHNRIGQDPLCGTTRRDARALPHSRQGSMPVRRASAQLKLWVLVYLFKAP